MSRSDIAVSVQQVSKRYRVFEDQRSRLLHALWPGHTRGMHEVWALRDVSFEIARGDSFAVIGRNGGGKSTLLQVITNTLSPTTGTVQVNGRVAALLELGSGFNPEYTGRENVFLNGLLLGLTRDEVERRFDDIAAFADVGNVLDRPLKTYSSGMVVRLAFAVQIALQPDILIVDEALSVGDYFFQQKCFGHLRKMRDDGLTLLFVSHDMGSVRDLCRRALYLRSGQAVAVGDTPSVVRQYFAETAPAPAAGAAPVPTSPDPAATPAALPRFDGDIAWSPRAKGTQSLLGVRLLDMHGTDVTSVRMSDPLRIRVYFRDPTAGPGLRVSLSLKNRYDQIVTAQNTEQLGLEIISFGQAAYAVVEFELAMQLEAGLYSMRVTLGLSTQANRGTPVDATDWFGPVHVQWDYEVEPAPFLGMFGVPAQVRLLPVQDGAAPATADGRP